MKNLTIIQMLFSVLLFSQEADFPKLSGPYLGQTAQGDIPVSFSKEILFPGCDLHSSPVFAPGLKEIDGLWTEPAVVSFSSALWDPDDPAISPRTGSLYSSATGAMEAVASIECRRMLSRS